MSFTLVGWLVASRLRDDGDAMGTKWESKATGLWLFILAVYVGLWYGGMDYRQADSMETVANQGDLSTLLREGLPLIAGGSSPLLLLVAAIGWLSGERWASRVAIAGWLVVALVESTGISLIIRDGMRQSFDLTDWTRTLESSLFDIRQVFTWLLPLWIGLRSGYPLPLRATGT
jgi:hypothetical protein